MIFPDTFFGLSPFPPDLNPSLSPPDRTIVVDDPSPPRRDCRFNSCCELNDVAGPGQTQALAELAWSGCRWMVRRSTEKVPRPSMWAARKARVSRRWSVRTLCWAIRRPWSVEETRKLLGL